MTTRGESNEPTSNQEQQETDSTSELPSQQQHQDVSVATPHELIDNTDSIIDNTDSIIEGPIVQDHSITNEIQHAVLSEEVDEGYVSDVESENDIDLDDVTEDPELEFDLTAPSDVTEDPELEFDLSGPSEVTEEKTESLAPEFQEFMFDDFTNQGN